MFRNVWSDLGMAGIDTYIVDARQAWQFASGHRFLLVGTIVPITLLFLPAPAC